MRPPGSATYGSQPVVREGHPSGTQVTSTFSQKTGFTAFQFTYWALLLNKYNSLQPANPLVS